MKTFKQYLKEGREWTGVDLDSTLAHYTEWKGATKIGKPISKMVDRIKKMLDNGEKVKIFTARADNPKAIKAIKKWLVEVADLPELEVTNIKDQFMTKLYDDRAIQVKKNTGEIVEENITVIEKLGALAAGLLAGSMLLPQTMQAKDNPNTAITQPATSTKFNSIINLILKHEGLIEGQTPFRITNPEMKKWDRIHGFKINKAAQKPMGRENYLFLQNPSDVSKAVKKQFINYANNPTRYGLKPNVSLKDALAKFDQNGVNSKISYLLKNIPDLDLDQPLKKYI